MLTSILSKKTTDSTAIITYVLDIILSLYVSTRVKFLISLTLNFQPPTRFIVIILLNFDNITMSFNKVLPNSIFYKIALGRIILLIMMIVIF